GFAGTLGRETVQASQEVVKAGRNSRVPGFPFAILQRATLAPERRRPLGAQRRVSRPAWSQDQEAGNPGDEKNGSHKRGPRVPFQPPHGPAGKGRRPGSNVLIGQEAIEVVRELGGGRVPPLA